MQTKAQKQFENHKLSGRNCLDIRMTMWIYVGGWKMPPCHEDESIAMDIG